MLYFLMFDTLLYLVHEIMYLDLIIPDIESHHNLYESKVNFYNYLTEFGVKHNK